MRRNLLNSLWAGRLLLALAAFSVFGSACARPAQAQRVWSLYHRGNSDHTGPDDKRSRTGGTIRAMQYLLQARGYPIVTDGVFGLATDQAVRRFEKAHHLVAEGETTTPFWEALVIQIKQGSTGPAVAAAQLRLRVYGYDVPPNGSFDLPTKIAVQKFQKQNSLTTDGIIGPATWNALMLGEGEGD